MSTRLDERTTTTRDLFQLPDVQQPLIHVGAPSAEPREVPTRALTGAMLAWMAMVFAVCYVGLPIATTALGLYDGVLEGIVFNLPSFVMATVCAVVGAAVTNPRIRTDVGAIRDPVGSATAGGLLTWALVHNVSPYLKHFTEFGSGELLSFLFINVVEMTLIGMMLGSFTRSRAVAFGLGVLFQLLVLGTVLGLVAL